jgi:hypothetical protein
MHRRAAAATPAFCFGSNRARVIARSKSDEAIQLCEAALDCFAAARNDRGALATTKRPGCRPIFRHARPQPPEERRRGVYHRAGHFGPDPLARLCAGHPAQLGNALPKESRWPGQARPLRLGSYLLPGGRWRRRHLNRGAGPLYPSRPCRTSSSCRARSFPRSGCDAGSRAWRSPRIGRRRRSRWRSCP